MSRLTPSQRHQARGLGRPCCRPDPRRARRPGGHLRQGRQPVVRATGTCTIASTATLKAKHDNGRIEVEFEVDQNRNNRLWRITITDDFHRVFTGSRRTLAPSGSFTVKRLIPNRAGVDTLRARAVNATSGEVCRVTLNV